jgi:hypothetical protein
MLRVNPIYGSQFDDRCPANTSRCTLVEYAGIRVLWNVGWKESLSPLPDHDLLLISDSTYKLPDDTVICNISNY